MRGLGRPGPRSFSICCFTRKRGTVGHLRGLGRPVPQSVYITRYLMCHVYILLDSLYCLYSCSSLISFLSNLYLRPTCASTGQHLTTKVSFTTDFNVTTGRLQSCVTDFCHNLSGLNVDVSSNYLLCRKPDTLCLEPQFITVVWFLTVIRILAPES